MSNPPALTEVAADAEVKDNNKPSKRIEYKRLEGEDAALLDAFFGIKDMMMEVLPGRVVIPHGFKDVGERILDMKVREDDVWLVACSRTGSTWAQEMVWCIGNDMDLEKANSTNQHIRAPTLELTSLLVKDHPLRADLGDTFENIVNMASPRFIKSHLPWDLLPVELDTVKPKIIYVMRNPKDQCVSYFHYCKLAHDYSGTMDSFVELFLRGRAPLGPIWNNIMGFWSRRHQPNIMILRYEDMKRDLAGIIRQTAVFLEKQLSDSDVERLVKHLSFNTMQKNPTVNMEPVLERSSGPDFREKTDLRFIRKGQVGDWKNHFSPEMSTRFDQWIKDNVSGTGLLFA